MVLQPVVIVGLAFISSVGLRRLVLDHGLSWRTDVLEILVLLPHGVSPVPDRIPILLL